MSVIMDQFSSGTCFSVLIQWSGMDMPGRECAKSNTENNKNEINNELDGTKETRKSIEQRNNPHAKKKKNTKDNRP